MSRGDNWGGPSATSRGERTDHPCHHDTYRIRIGMVVAALLVVAAFICICVGWDDAVDALLYIAAVFFTAALLIEVVNW